MAAMGLFGVAEAAAQGDRVVIATPSLPHLRDVCASGDPRVRAYCTGYIEGHVDDTFIVLNARGLGPAALSFCIPRAITNDQLDAAVAKGLADLTRRMDVASSEFPEMVPPSDKMSAVLNLDQVLKAVFPC